MVLQGLTVPTWAGWLTGMLFYQVPWGIPKHKTWCEPTFIYHVSLNIFSNLLWLDYICNFSETFADDLLIRDIISKVFTYMSIICSNYLRLCYAIYAKKSAHFFRRIEQHPIFLNPTKSLPDPSEKQVISRADKIILIFALVLKTTAAAAFAAAIATQRKRENSIFSMLSTFEYFLVFFVFGCFTTAVSIHIAFSYTLVITRYLIFIFEEFCNYFEQVIKFGPNGFSQEKEQPPPCPFLFQNKADLMNINHRKQMYESLLRQFDSISELFQLYDEVAGPILLGLVVVTVMFFVQTVNAIFIFQLSPLFIVFDWFTLICLVSQLVLILFNLGHSAHRTIAFRKFKLRRALADIRNTFEKEQLVEVHRLVHCWNWKMSAWGFFVIDRSLVPGVLSIMMSYIVILFQLQIAFDRKKV